MKKVLMLMTFILSACSGEKILDRAPDYRTSRVMNRLEVPPNLVALDNQGLVIPNEGSSTYNAQQIQTPSINEVLPELHNVNVQGNVIVAAANVDVVWKYVKQFFSANGINLAEEQSHIGLMVTDWLEDQNKLPQSGFARLLNSVGLIDSGERDRYRVEFSRSLHGTQIIISHVMMEEKADKENTREEIGSYHWVESGKGDRQLSDYMAKRIALYISQQMLRAK